MKTRHFAFVCMLLLGANQSFPGGNLFSREKPVSKTVVPGAAYEAGWMHRLFFGNHWRNIWTRPVDVNVLDLRTDKGGLTPLRRGGGKQTKSLRLRGGDGKDYKFRSIQKDPAKVLSPDLQESIAADILQDQISSSNPFAPVIAAPLLDAAGVLNVTPEVVLLPDDELLGEYRPEFGGLLGTVEEDPKGAQGDKDGFAGAKKIINTFPLLNRLESSGRDRVDAAEYLKARLMDIFIGDWDRHQDQWQWAGYEGTEGWIWKPVPRDRDQAFSRFDGLFPWMATNYVDQLKGFGKNYPSIEGLTWSGRYTDRRLLVGLEKPVWDSVAAWLTGKLTDSVLSYAVNNSPMRSDSAEAAELVQTLRARRDKLTSASAEFYEILARFVDVRGTEKPDVADVTRLNDHQISVSLAERNGSASRENVRPLYNRVFDDAETDEIRLYLSKGDDTVIVSGTGGSSIRIVVDGGNGEDNLIDTSDLQTSLYDDGKKTHVTLGEHTKINRDHTEIPEEDSLRYEPAQRDYGHTWLFVPWMNFNPDEGFFLGGSELLTDYAFRSRPYNYSMEFRGGFTTRTGRVRLAYTARSYSLLSGACLSLTGGISQIEQLNYFGTGNETVRDEARVKAKYYEVRQTQLLLRPSVEFDLADNFTATLGGSLKVVKNEQDSAGILNDQNLYGVGGYSAFGSLYAGITLDSRDRRTLSTRGVFLHTEGSYTPVLFDNEQKFGKISAELHTYLSAGPGDHTVTLALRAGGEKVWGTYPFFESAFIGGQNTLRGFDKERFAGDASLYGTAELRLHVGTFHWLLPGHYGISLFSDAGRVFVENESSVLWHSSVGGGVWFSLLQDVFVLNLSMAHSVEGNGVYLSTSFF